MGDPILKARLLDIRWCRGEQDDYYKAKKEYVRGEPDPSYTAVNRYL